MSAQAPLPPSAAESLYADGALRAHDMRFEATESVLALRLD